MCVQRERNAFLDFYGRIWKFQEVSQSCNILQLGVDRRSNILRPVCRYVLTLISVKILHKCDETSLTVTHIVLSLTLSLMGQNYDIKVMMVIDFSVTFQSSLKRKSLKA